MDLSDTSVKNEPSDVEELALVARILSWLFLLGLLPSKETVRKIDVRKD